KKTSGQIIYTDIDPDTMYSTTDGGAEEAKLDLNNDGLIDLTLVMNGSPTYEHGYIGPLGASIQHYHDYYRIARALDYGDSIKDGSHWKNCFWIQYGIIGYFNDAGDKYLPVRIKTGQGFYYGWVRLSVSDESHQMIIKDYALNSELNESILA